LASSYLLRAIGKEACPSRGFQLPQGEKGQKIRPVQKTADTAKEGQEVQGLPINKRFMELNSKKTDMVVDLFKRVNQRKIEVDHILLDSWFTTISLINEYLSVNKRSACHWDVQVQQQVVDGREAIFNQTAQKAQGQNLEGQVAEVVLLSICWRDRWCPGKGAYLQKGRQWGMAHHNYHRHKIDL